MHIKQITETDYNLFCHKSGNATFFHSIEWHSILKTAFDIDLLYLGLFQRDNLVGVIPVMRRKVFVLNIYGAPLPKSATPNIFPLFNHDESSDVLKAIDRWTKDKEWKHLQICWPLDCLNTLKNVKEETRLLVKIDIDRPIEEIWGQIKKWVRKRIRHALRNKIRIHSYVAKRYLDEYPRLLHHTFDISQGIGPNAPSILFDEIKRKKERLPLRIFTATYKGNVVAMLWIFFDKDTCYFWEGASDAKGKELSANHLLHWEAIRWAHKQDLKVIDMVGGSRRGIKCDEGILRFKEGFGATAHECKVLYWQPELVQALFRAYRRYLYIKDRPTK